MFAGHIRLITAFIVH